MSLQILQTAPLSTRACVTTDVLQICQNYTTSGASRHMNIKQDDGNCKQLHPWHLWEAEALELSTTTRHITIQYFEVQTADCSLPHPCQAHYLSRHQCYHQFHWQRTHPNLSHIQKTFHWRQYLALKLLDPVAAKHFVPHQTSKCIFRNHSICSPVSLYQCTQYTDQLINTHSIQSLKNSQSRMLTKRTNNLKNWQPFDYRRG